jgi:hypothetical protein
MALAEACAMMPRNRKLKAAAQMGLDYIIRQQPPYGAFGYNGPGTDVSVTGFQIQAIKSAYIADLKVPKQAKERTERFLSICMAKDYGTPYRIKPNAKVQAGGRTTMTAAALTGRLFMGRHRTAPDCKGQAAYLTRGNRHLAAAKGSNYYEIYYYSLAMFNMGGNYWKSWNNAFNGPLRAKQVQKGPERGSWPHNKGAQYGRHGGRVYTTSIACLALEVYFRYLPTYKSF